MLRNPDTIAVRFVFTSSFLAIRTTYVVKALPAQRINYCKFWKKLFGFQSFNTIILRFISEALVKTFLKRHLSDAAQNAMRRHFNRIEARSKE